MEPGIAEEWGAGIGDEGHGLARGQALGEPGAQAALVVVVVGEERGVDAEMGEEPPAVAGVLGQDQVHRPQHGLGARAQIGEVADRGRDDVQGPALHRLVD